MSVSVNQRCGKRRFRTELDAKIQLANTYRKNANPNRQETRVYLCPKCKGFHMTSKSAWA